MINFTSDPEEASWHGYLYAVLLFLTAVVQSLFLHQYFHRCYTLGMRIRSAIIAAVYDKVSLMYCTYPNILICSLYNCRR